MMKFPTRIESGARRRVTKATDQIRYSLQMVREGVPLAAEWERQRLIDRLRFKALLSREEAEAVARGIGAKAREAAAREAKARETKATGKAARPEQIWGNTIDFVAAAFLERGHIAARAVARVAFRDGRPQGTGFLVSERLFLTNNHVIGSREEAAQFAVEFDYEVDANGNQRPTTRFALDPATFFLTHPRDDLDFTLIAVGERLSGPKALTDFPCCPLSNATDKHALGEVANIVQHPDGRLKEVVLRENRLVARLDTVLHYVADTEPGASGSPVFNNEWQVIALHHWGGPWRQKVDDQGQPLEKEVNEGIRASAIVNQLRLSVPSLNPPARSLLQATLRLGEGAPGPAPLESSHAQANGSGGATLDADGRILWRVPLEISVRLPLLSTSSPALAVAARVDSDAHEERHVDPNYDNRSGYKAGFIAGHPIELPKLSAAQRGIAARNLEAEPGDDPLEFKYHHFSIVMNGPRRLAFVTACNIDGTKAKFVDRKTGVVTPHLPGQHDEALDEAAEASETWYDDQRVEDDKITPGNLYTGQSVPGVHNKHSRDHLNRIFQRGHLVRRLDPVWGTDDQALRAEADTFHLTNCTPQVGFFNMGSAPASTPGSGGGRLWRAIEDYVLDNAVDEQKRVSVFTGPILSQEDPLWRTDIVPGFQVPLRFWKIVAWSANGQLRSVGMIADQTPVIQVMPELAETYADTSPVQDFLTTIAEIERLTGLDFGNAVRAADTSAGEFARRATRQQMRLVTDIGNVPVGVRTRGVAGKTSRLRGARSEQAPFARKRPPATALR